MRVKELIKELLDRNMDERVELVDGTVEVFDDCSTTNEPCLKLVVKSYRGHTDTVFTSRDEYY